MRFRNKAHNQFVRDLVRVRYEKINVSPGACRYNYKCHKNAIHEAIEQKHKRVAVVFAIENAWTCVHFINVDNKGRYTDNTLGHLSSQVEYHLIEYIEEARFFKNDEILDYWQEWIRSQIPWHILWFSTIRN